MREYLRDSEIGEIIYEESMWSGKKTVYINGKMLLKTGKNMFAWENNGEQSYVIVKGNIFSGLYLEIGGRDIVVSGKPEWYELTLAILTFVLCLVWGNSPTLCSIVPIVGGAIGGMISGALTFTSLLLMKRSKEVWKKILIGVGMIVGAFLACFIAGMILLVLIAA